MGKLLNHALPDGKNFEKFAEQMQEFRAILNKRLEDEAPKELIRLAGELIGNQDDDGYWRLISSEDMPFEAKIDFWKYPTVLFTALLIKMLVNYPKACEKMAGFDNALTSALAIITKGKLTGHGYGSFQFLLDGLKILAEADVIAFIEKYPRRHPGFNAMIKLHKSEIENLLREKRTRVGLNEEFGLRIRELADKMNGKSYLFVYGTLMQTNRKQDAFLKEAEFRGKFVLEGYGLYDLGYYPGIVESRGDKVKGELYAVPKAQLKEIDIYEAEGSLYRRRVVQLRNESNEPVDAYVYVYNCSIDDKTKVPLSFQPWFKGVVDRLQDYVWYACYGSNINRERFMKYINGDPDGTRENLRNGCENKEPPLNEEPLIIEHPIYFAKKSPRWKNRGVAFLDTTKKGKSYGKMYLITREQFDEIRELEGPGWYNEEVELGFKDGIPIYTFTHKPRYTEDVMPDRGYIEIIKKGIRETFPKMEDEDIEVYLSR